MSLSAQDRSTNHANDLLSSVSLPNSSRGLGSPVQSWPPQSQSKGPPLLDSDPSILELHLDR